MAKVPDLPLVIAGNDDEDYTPKLRRLVQSLGLESRVVFTGPVSDEHKWALYEKAELFLLPSYSENFGMVVGEAMAMGCPVAVTPEVGIAALVESTGAGIVSDGAPRTFAAAVQSLLSDPQRAREMGANGARAARERLSWDAMAAQAEELYRQVIGMPPRRPIIGDQASTTVVR